MTGSSYVFLFAIGVVFVCQFYSSQAGSAVPVLLWGAGNTDAKTGGVNPFWKTSQSEFTKLLMNRMGGSLLPLVVFDRETLCTEDLTRNKEILREITHDESAAYIPAVNLPMSVFKGLASYNQSSYDDLDGDSISEGQMIIKQVVELNAIQDIYKSLKESTPNLIAVLTGNTCPYSRADRIKRDVPSNDTSELIINTERVLLYSKKGIYMKFEKDEGYYNLGNKPYAQDIITTDDKLVRMKVIYNTTHGSTYKIGLDFLFTVKTPGYYTLTLAYSANNTNNVTLKSSTDIVFPFNFSYHCSQNSVFYSSDVYVNITDMQVQVDAKKVNDVKRFNDAYDCVGFTTIPIWTGIFVTAILAIIMIWALTMIIDIRTMDRFDDPKGKTITISAQE